jgi:glycosyltransferase involved in cell wall biosynthesis
MRNAKPTITVLMPAHNAAKYIGEAITSILEQTFINFELLIINDGSTDETKNVIKAFNDERIILINQASQGVAVALNNGLMIAKADYIARFDADDICVPERLQVQHDFLSNHPDYIIIGSDADYIDMNDEFVFSYDSYCYTNEEIQRNKFKTCPFIHSSVFFRKEAVIKAGGYNIHAHTFEDHLLWPKILSQGKGYNSSKKLLKVRLNPDSITIDEKWRCKRFHKIKNEAIRKGNINETEGDELIAILKEQNKQKIKEGSYYALLSKKYLWNNYQPKKARQNLKKSLLLKPMNIDSYLLLLLSYMPDKFIQRVYNWQRDAQI